VPEVVLQRPVSRPSFASLYQAVHGDAMTAILNATITAPGTFFGQAFMPGDKRQPFVPQHHNIESAFSYGSGGASVDVHRHVSAMDVGHDNRSRHRKVGFSNPRS
jgi:hypothetical protein